MKNKQFIYKTLFVFSLFLSLQSILAQDILMQGWYWDYPKTANGHNWADTIEAKATELAEAGITHVWLPPLSRASSGSYSNGYDPRDLYDLGEFGGGATGFGTRAQLDDIIDLFDNVGIEAVADVVYNHRDGGGAEDNSAVEGWIESYNSTKVNAGDAPFPSDRYRCVLPLGGTSGNGAGDYYFKIRSASQHSNYHNKPYKIYVNTDVIGYQNLPDQSETEPNGGGDCSQGNNAISLGVNMTANTDGIGCLIDEFKLTITENDFNASGDALYIYLTNEGGNYSDHYIHGLWSAALSQNIQDQIIYQTYTNFNYMPSGRGGMNHTNFRPNGNPTSLSGDWDGMWFYYDYDQTKIETIDTLQEWSKWLWQDVGIRGYRMDAVKHFPNSFTGNLMDYLHYSGMNPSIVVGEYFDTNAGTLKGWVDNVLNEMDTDTKNHISVRAFDFSLRKALKDACDAFGYDARNIFGAGIVDGAGGSGFQAVTFLNNHDYRADYDPPVQSDPILGYAYLLTNNQVGLPCIFYPDYYGTPIPHSPGISLKNQLDDLLHIHKVYIHGSTGRDYLSRFFTPYYQNITNNLYSTTLAYQIMGTPTGKDIIVVINFAGETLDMTHGVNVNTNLPNGTILTDLTGTSNTPTTTVTNGNITVSIPARSYAVYGVNICTTNPPMISAGQDVTICTGNSTQLGATGGVEYEWSPNDGSLSDITIPNPTANPNSTRTYTVLVTDSNGCTASDQVTVNVDNVANCCPDGVMVEYKNTNTLPPMTQASNFIRAGNLNEAGNVVIEDGQNVSFQAANYISLESGFSVESGGIFETILQQCNNASVVEESPSNSFAAKKALTELTAKVYPNPFRERTTIAYFLPEHNSPVTMSIYDLSGKIVQTLINNQVQDSGAYEVTFNPCNLAEGIYICVLEVKGEMRAVKLVKEQ